MEEWKNGRMEEWKNGGVLCIVYRIYTIYTPYTHYTHYDVVPFKRSAAPTLIT